MSRLSRSVVVLVPFLTLAAGFLAPRAGRALPLWARQNSMPCTSCHLAFPRLNDFGMAFRQRGYLLPGSEGQSPWESQFVPISFVANVGYDLVSTSHFDPAADKWTRFTTAAFAQNQYEFHSAGTLAKKITFHLDSDFSGTGAPLEAGQAFVQFDDVAKEGALNVKAGIFDAEVPYLSSSRRTTWADYDLPGTLPGEGIELNGNRDGWTYAAAVINSGRTVDAVTAAKPDTKFLNNLESPYAWLMRDVGPHKVTARVFFDRQNPRKTGSSASTKLQLDVNALLELGRLWLIPDYTYEHFSDPDSSVDETGAIVFSPVPDVVHHGLLEAVVLLDKNARVLFTGRYELAHNARRTSEGAVLVPERDVSLGALNLSYYVNPNAKLALDWTHRWDNLRSDRADEVQAFVFVGY